jgi:hypothetical protein
MTGIVVRDYGPRLEPDQDPRRAPAAGEKRRRAMTQVVAADRAWKGDAVDPENFRTMVVPRLKHLKLEALAAATGLTRSACSRIRAGQAVPHPRHWGALAELLCREGSGSL